MHLCLRAMVGVAEPETGECTLCAVVLGGVVSSVLFGMVMGLGGVVHRRPAVENGPRLLVGDRRAVAGPGRFVVEALVGAAVVVPADV